MNAITRISALKTAHPGPLKPSLVSLTLLLALVVNLTSSGFLTQVQAGEKLNITGQKTRLHPSQDKKNSADFKNSLANSYIQAPYDGSTKPRPRLDTPSRNSKLDRKLQNERDEKANWALLSPGQLQANEDQEQYNFGLREVGAEKNGGNGESRPRDYTFYGLDKAFNKNNSPNNASHAENDSTGARPNNPLSKPYSGSAEQNSPMRLNVFETETQNGGPSMGSHVSSALNIRSLLNPDVTSAGYAGPHENSDVSLRSLLGAPAQNFQTRQQDQQMDNFRKLLNPYQDNNARLTGLSDPVNHAPDRTSQPLNPVEGSTLGFPPSSLLKDSSASAIATPSRGLLPPPSTPGYGQPTISGFSSLPSPALPRPEPLNDLRSAPISRSPIRRP